MIACVLSCRMDRRVAFEVPCSDDVNWVARDVVTVEAYGGLRFHEMRASFIEALHSFPEFVYDGKGPIVLGGFGGFGNPAAFHHPVVRRIRYDQEMSAAVAMRDRVRDDSMLEILFDRPCLRAAGTMYVEEKWHRDMGPAISVGQEVWGGWLNLDLNPQVCCSCSCSCS